MKVCIFTECHKNTGRGHLTRCLSLAEEFCLRNIEALLFLDNKGNESINQADKKIIPLLWLSDIELFKEKVKDADVVILDSYLANEEYYKIASCASKAPVYFDDYSRITYPHGIIINGSPGIGPDFYSNVNTNFLLTGMKFQIVRKEFQSTTDKVHHDIIKNILITIGGSSNVELFKTIIAITKKNIPHAILHVVSDEKFSDENVISYSRVPAEEMKNIMSFCDLAITGAGQTIFELMIAATPFIAIQIAENQKYNSKGVAKTQKNLSITDYKINFEKKLSEAIQFILPYKKRMEVAGVWQKKIDEQGASRIVTEILKQIIVKEFRLRKALPADLMKIYNLSNEPEVRKNSFRSEEISLKNHTEWFQRIINDSAALLLVAEIIDVFAGQIRYNINKNECTVGLSVCSQLRGLSIGERLLRESIPMLKAVFPKVKKINAWVKPENSGSNKLFLKAGYLLEKECDEDNHNAKKYRLTL